MRALRSPLRLYGPLLGLSLLWIVFGLVSSAAASTPARCRGSGDPFPPLVPQTKTADFAPWIIAYLNALGSSNGLQESFSRLRDPAHPDAPYQVSVVNRDVTGDETSDVVVNIRLPVSGSGALFVFSCRSGKYIQLYQNTNDTTLVAVKDMNADGKAEIVYSNPDCTVGCMVYYDILAYDGKGFASLARNNDAPCFGPCLVNGSAEITGPDRNGTLALVLKEGWDGRYGPGCDLRTTWSWSGAAFVKTGNPTCLPRFRIHAVYAGDDAAQARNYFQALGFYQQVIFEAGLLPGRDWQRRELAAGPQFIPPSDPTEWAILSAYARYRILLLQVLWKDEASARLVYRSLETQFPAGSPGHAYTLLATVFWDAYQSTHNLDSACSQASQYASANNEAILTSLSQAVYGKNNRDYQPADICPFK